MLVDKFIAEYNRASKKEEFFARHITNKYVPYEEKIVDCKNIVAASMYSDVNDKRVFLQNTPGQYLFFVSRLLLRYTDIEIPENTILRVYNELNKNELIEPILAAIPKREYDEFNTILRMAVADEIENYRSFAGFCETKLEAAGLLLDTFKDAMPDKEELAKIINNINAEENNSDEDESE